MVGVEEKNVPSTAAFGHMKTVVAALATERPKGALDNLEAYSRFVATGTAVPAYTRSVYQDAQPKPAPASGPRSATSAKNTAWVRAFQEQVAPPKPRRNIGEDEEDEPMEDEDLDGPDKGDLPDVVLEQTRFRSAGVGLPEMEAYRVSVAIKRLIDKEPLQKARFWGKIFGKENDYYIAESKIDESRVPEREEDEPLDEEEPEGRPPGTIQQALAAYKVREPPAVLVEQEKGVNEYKYYVASSNDLTEWVALPDCRPACAMAARHISKLFTGDLNALVQCHPPFPGTERDYLRAQIARISHGTMVCPKDIYSTDPVEEEEDEDGNIKPRPYAVPAPEEPPAQNPQDVPDPEDVEAVAPVKIWFTGYPADELLGLTHWVHCQPQLLLCGRVTVNKPEEELQLDEDEEEPPAPPAETIHPFLGDLDHDAPLPAPLHSKTSLRPWALRKAPSAPGAAVRTYLCRSLRWPGAFCVAMVETDKPGAEYQNVYIGRGVKAEALHQPFCPPLPPMPCVEYPVGDVKLQRDATRDDELEFEPAPPKPVLEGDGEEEEEEED